MPAGPGLVRSDPFLVLPGGVGEAGPDPVLEFAEPGVVVADAGHVLVVGAVLGVVVGAVVVASLGLDMDDPLCLDVLAAIALLPLLLLLVRPLARRGMGAVVGVVVGTAIVACLVLVVADASHGLVPACLVLVLADASHGLVLSDVLPGVGLGKHHGEALPVDL